MLCFYQNIIKWSRTRKGPPGEVEGVRGGIEELHELKEVRAEPRAIHDLRNEDRLGIGGEEEVEEEEEEKGRPHRSARDQ